MRQEKSGDFIGCHPAREGMEKDRSNGNLASLWIFFANFTLNVIFGTFLSLALHKSNSGMPYALKCSINQRTLHTFIVNDRNKLHMLAEYSKLPCALLEVIQLACLFGCLRAFDADGVNKTERFWPN